MAKLTKGEIEIKLHDGSGETRKLPVLLIGGTGFALHKSKAITEPWTVFHVPTGLQTGGSKTRVIAIARAEKMQAILSQMSNGADTIKNPKNEADRDLVNRMRYYGTVWEPGKPEYEDRG